MIIETAALISVGSWLGNKLLDKGFDEVYDKITSKSFDEKFYKKVNNTAKKLQKKYPDVLGGNFEYFFKHESIVNGLMKLLFIDSKVNIAIIEEKFDIKTLPSGFILEFITLLKKELHKDIFFNELLSNKEIYLITLGIENKIEDVLEISTLSFNEVKDLRQIIESKFQDQFDFSDFIKKYKKSLINNYT
ncbi:hypothetical protein [uncultured Dokdonia sp.]|uniref:hypothetical protein n=1 Tax=uncultured Dokdonia sp. TaxID=575653 RepID=UPI002629522C|nr:hypothetical protein [uncultured Dokdonia sp.]